MTAVDTGQVADPASASFVVVHPHSKPGELLDHPGAVADGYGSSPGRRPAPDQSGDVALVVAPTPRMRQNNLSEQIFEWASIGAARPQISLLCSTAKESMHEGAYAYTQ